MLEKCDSLHNFKKTAPLLIKTKVTALERPLDEMVINPIQKSKYFSREADILLLCLTHEIGYGKWQQIKHAIRRDNRVKTIEKEIEIEQRAPRKQNQAIEDINNEDAEMQSEQSSNSDVEMKNGSE